MVYYYYSFVDIVGFLSKRVSYNYERRKKGTSCIINISKYFLSIFSTKKLQFYAQILICFYTVIKLNMKPYNVKLYNNVHNYLGKNMLHSIFYKKNYYSY